MIQIHEIAYASVEYHLAVDLRQKVLRQPLGLELTAADLANEDRQIHIGAFFEGRLVGCLILAPNHPVVKMRQVAVDPDRQGLGTGRKLVEFAEARSRQLGFVQMELHARETAVSFYLNLGYHFVGDTFNEVTLPHRQMRKVLG